MGDHLSKSPKGNVSNQNLPANNNPTFQFSDNRQETTAQRNFAHLVNSGKPVIQGKLHQFQPYSNSPEIIQRAKLGTGQLYSAKKYVSWYFSGGNPLLRKGDALRELYNQIGIDNDSDEDRRTKPKLKQDEVIDDQDIKDLEDSVDKYLKGGKAAIPPERKLLPAQTWKHIWRGDFNSGKKKPTGYHWKGKGDESWLEGTGVEGKSASGFYEEQVKVRDDKVEDIKAETNAKGDISGKIKDEKSTFFPDNWTESDVKDAIETRNGEGKITTKSVDAITLVKSGGTIFPSID